MPGFGRKRTFPYKLRMWQGRLIARLPAWRMAASKDITVSNRHTRKGRQERERGLGLILYFASFFSAAIRSDQLSE